MTAATRAGPGRPGVATGRVAVTVAGLTAAAGLVVVPLVELVRIVLADGGSSLGRVLRAPGLGTAAAHTVLLAAVVTAVAVPSGAATALFLRRGDVPGRRVLRVAVVLPLVVPQFVLGYSWTQAYGRAGFLDRLLGVRWDGLTGPAGVAVVLVVDAAPLCYLLTAVGLATRARPDLEQAARVSGAGAWTVLRTVTLPLVRPVLAAAAVLTFVSTAESFAVPQVLGTPAGFATLTTRIYSDVALGSDPTSFPDAVTLSVGLVLLAAVVLVPADLVLAPRLRATRGGHGARAATATGRSARGALGALALLGYAVLAAGLPTVALVAAAVTRAVGLPPTPSNWTLDNLRDALDGPTLVGLEHSLLLAAVAACVLTVLGGAVAAGQRRRSGTALGTLAVLTFAVPGSALAVGLLVAYGRWLGGGITLILVAYLAKFWALAHRTVTGADDRLPPAELRAARVSGAGPVVAARTVWLPALAPALLGAWGLVFLAVLHEVTMSSLLYTVGNQTLAVAVLDQQELGGVGTTAALSVVLTALVAAAAVPGWFAWRLASRARGVPGAR